jgi:hypothetical protein
MNNHQNAIFYPLDNFIKYSHNFAMIIFQMQERFKFALISWSKLHSLEISVTKFFFREKHVNGHA